MKGKDKAKVLWQKNRGGKSRTPDLAMTPEQGRLPEGLPELTEAAIEASFGIAVEFEPLFQRLRLRKVDLEAFVHAFNEYLGDRQVPESRLVQCLNGAIVEPLCELSRKIADLEHEVARSNESTMRSLVRNAVSADESNFHKMLRAFEERVNAILVLNAKDREGQVSITRALQAVNECADRGERIILQIVGQKNDKGINLQGIESRLGVLTRSISRELNDDDDESVRTPGNLEARWIEIEALLGSYQKAVREFNQASEEYNSKARMFFIEHDAFRLYSGEWTRLKEVIRHSYEGFRAAELDPFELSEVLADIDPQTVFTIPYQEERDALEGQVPKSFPKFPESRVEERAKSVIDDLVKAMETSVPSSIPASSSSVSEKCPVTLSELALCTYAVFVARYANGNPNHTSGRTAARVYEMILVPLQLTYGYTGKQFEAALQEAEKVGLMQHFSPRAGKHICYQPTVNGFAYAESLYPKLSPNFKDRVFAQYEQLRSASEQFRQRISKKPT